MARASRLTDERLTNLYNAAGFGGETTMRAKVIRELIDEIRDICAALEAARAEFDRLMSGSADTGQTSHHVGR